MTEHREHGLHYTEKSGPQHSEHHLRTPSGELSHEELLARQSQHVRLLTGVLVLVGLVLVYAAAFDLNSWPEWIVFGGICVTAIGAIIATSPSRRS